MQTQTQRLFISVVIFLGVASFISCLTAEFKKSKKEDVRWDGDTNCYIPESQAFGLGTSAVLCLGLAQILGNLVMYHNHRTIHKKGDGSKVANLTLITVLLLLSWVSFVVVVLLLTTATSMSRTQAYRKGWLKQECYLVKDGVYAGSGCLVLLALSTLIVAAAKIKEKKLIDQVKEAHDNITQTQNQIPRNKSETVISIVEEANSIADISRI